MRERLWKRAIRLGLFMGLGTLVAPGLAGCTAQETGGVVDQAGLLRSDRPRLAALSPDEARLSELVAGNTAFALDFYQALFDNRRNLFYSPHSLSLALGMTYAGARGQTEQQMAEVLHFTLPQAQLHPALNTLDQALAGRGQGEEEEAFRLYIANAIWGQQGHPFLETFLDTLAQNYGAGLRVVDFRQAEEARGLINQWVSEQTERRIQDLLPPGSIDALTALVLTNAIYFKAAWMHPFMPGQTHDGTFTLLDGGQVSVPMMEQLASLGYAERAGVQAVELPYAGGELSMVVLLPEAGTFEAFARGLDVAKLEAILRDLRPAQVWLTMPRFRSDSKFMLQDALMELGMVDAFGDADFSGMDGTRELLIDEVYHNAFVAVDEAGTEAAAATAVVVARSAAPAVEQEVKVDRPFLFLIRDIETGAILFLGHVVNPAS